MSTPERLLQFASDNYAGICPPVLDAIERANAGFAPGYGADRWTTRAADLVRDTFEADAEVFFCFNGTAANSLALAHLCRPYHSVIAHELAHVETDECGGPEFFSHGAKLLLAGGDHAKLTPDAVTHLVQKRSDIHYPKPRVLSVTQSTELGTVYSVDELAALGERARRHHLHVHMDGARFANAVASLGVAPRQLTVDLGVDVLSFGGTKNGMPVGEAIVFFDRALAAEFDYRCKQAGQLASKMRFMAAPWVGMLEDGAWLANAHHANARARQLADGLVGIPGLAPAYPVQANAVFIDLTAPQRQALEDRGVRAYAFIGGATRFMCSWATTDDDVAALLEVLREVAG